MDLRPIGRRWRRRLATGALAILVAVVLPEATGAAVDDDPAGTSDTAAASTTTATSTSTSVVADRVATGEGAAGGNWVDVLAETPASGGAVGVRGGVFAPLSTVEIWFPERDRRLATTTADLDGEIAANITLPAVSAGTYEIRLLGTGPDGELVDVATDVTVAEESVVREPVTGSPIASDAMPIMLVIAVLGGLFLARRTARRVKRMEDDART